MSKKYCSAECMNADCEFNTWVIPVEIEDFFNSEDISSDCPDYEPDDYEDDDPEELDFN